jgi:hypothetical protein
MTISTLDKLKKQREQLDARIQAAESRQKVSQRKQDTRRKILLGSYYLDQAQKNNQWKKTQELMSNYLKRNSDRKLFDLPEIEELNAKIS